MSVADIIQKVQVQFDALAEDWCDKDYIINFLEMHNEDVESLLEDLDLSYDTAVIVLPAVAAGTTDLSAFQVTGQPLANMMLPLALEWRLVGETDLQWRPIPQVDKVIDVLVATPGGPSATAGIASYEWRGGIVYISPSSVATDIRIRDEQLPAVLDSDSAVYIKGLSNVLAYGICEHIAMNRGGGVSKQAPWFHQKFEDAFTSVSDRMVKQEQVVPRRMAGRRSRWGGPLWRAPMG